MPALLVPDNTKVAVIKACLYDPVINRTYADMAAHYGTAVLPARPYKPRDKAKVEVGVLIAERWLLGRLRHTTVPQPGRVEYGHCRVLPPPERRARHPRVGHRPGEQLLETDRSPALKTVAGGALWCWRSGASDASASTTMSRSRTTSTACRTGYARAEVDARFTARTVEVFLRGERIATHRRGSGDGKHTTLPDHMPSSHRRYADWTIERIGREAAAIGPSVGILMYTLILERRPHPEQGFRACLGILRLARSVRPGVWTRPRNAPSRSGR